MSWLSHKHLYTSLSGNRIDKLLKFFFYDYFFFIDYFYFVCFYTIYFALILLMYIIIWSVWSLSRPADEWRCTCCVICVIHYLKLVLVHCSLTCQLGVSVFTLVTAMLSPDTPKQITVCPKCTRPAAASIKASGPPMLFMLYGKRFFITHILFFTDFCF